jgi:hypothetical protein
LTPENRNLDVDPTRRIDSRRVDVRVDAILLALAPVLVGIATWLCLRTREPAVGVVAACFSALAIIAVAMWYRRGAYADDRPASDFTSTAIRVLVIIPLLVLLWRELDLLATVLDSDAFAFRAPQIVVQPAQGAANAQQNLSAAHGMLWPTAFAVVGVSVTLTGVFIATLWAIARVAREE